MVEFNFTFDLKKGRLTHAQPLNELIKAVVNPSLLLHPPYNLRWFCRHIILNAKFYIGVKDHSMIQSLLNRDFAFFASLFNTEFATGESSTSLMSSIL